MADDNLRIDWFIGVTSDEDKAAFERMIRSCSKDRMWRQLQALMQRKLNSVESWENSPDSYKEPSWACAQAHRNGSKSILEYVLSLLNFVETTEKS